MIFHMYLKLVLKIKLHCIYEIIDNNQIKIYSPYPYIIKTKQWYRIHAGSIHNTNGKMSGEHLSYILGLKHITNPNGSMLIIFIQKKLKII